MSQDPTPDNRKNTRYLILLCVNTVLFFFFYRILLSIGEMTHQTFYAFVCMILYLLLLLSFTLAYLIYNRFFYRQGITQEQLPEEWSTEKKIAFLAEGKLRMEKSKWMLTVIFPLIFTFLVDAIELFIFDTVFW